MDNSLEFVSRHVLSFLQNSGPENHAFSAVICHNITEKPNLATMRVILTRVNGNIVIELEMIELACTTREGLERSLT